MNADCHKNPLSLTLWSRGPPLTEKEGPSLAAFAGVKICCQAYLLSPLGDAAIERTQRNAYLQSDVQKRAVDEFLVAASFSLGLAGVTVWDFPGSLEPGDPHLILCLVCCRPFSFILSFSPQKADGTLLSLLIRNLRLQVSRS